MKMNLLDLYKYREIIMYVKMLFCYDICIQL